MRAIKCEISIEEMKRKLSGLYGESWKYLRSISKIGKENLEESNKMNIFPHIVFINLFKS